MFKGKGPVWLIGAGAIVVILAANAQTVGDIVTSALVAVNQIIHSIHIST